MTEVTPHPLKTQGFHHFLILLFYDHPANGDFIFCSYKKISGSFTVFKNSLKRAYYLSVQSNQYNS